MENLAYCKHKNIRDKSTLNKMSRMMNKQMCLEISSCELKKKQLLCWEYTCKKKVMNLILFLFI